MRARTLIDRFGIRTRIAGGSLIIAILISVAAGIVFNTQIERIVRDGTTAVLTSDSAPYVVALHTEPEDSFDPPGPSQLVAVLAPGGTTPVDTLPATLSAMLPGIATSGGAHEVTTPHASYIVLTTTVAVAGANWQVVAARNAAEETTTLRQMRMLLFAGLTVVALGTAVAAWALTTVSLGPVRRLRRNAETLSGSPTTELLTVGEANDEISDLARTLNDLIERLRRSALRERQLVSDASHELRTPIAILTTQLQVALAEASSMEQMVRDVEGAKRNVARLSALVTSLLELSAIEADQTGSSTVRELDREGAEAVDRAQFRSGASNVQITYSGPSDTQPGSDPSNQHCSVRPEDFGRLIDNLMNNALHALNGTGKLLVRLEPRAASVVLTVTDTGGGLDPAFAPNALDRFTRADTSRPGGHGAGLGLAIVAAIVKNAHGTIALDNHPGDGLTVRINLPTFTVRGDERTTSP